MSLDFFQKQEMIYSEIGVLLEDVEYTQKAKIYIPILLPNMSSTTTTNTKVAKPTVSNILNESGRRGVSSYILSNYIELDIPKYIGNTIKNSDGIISKGTKFILTFIGGEINRPKIIGIDEIITTDTNTTDDATVISGGTSSTML